MNEAQSAILELLQNYAQCEYPLSIEQIHRMLPVKVTETDLVEHIQKISSLRLVSMHETQPWYTVKGHEITFRRRGERGETSRKKRSILERFLQFLCVCPWVRTVVLTGSLALDNAKASDDIDLMIITAPKTMFLCRLYAFLLAIILGLARSRLSETQRDVICVNIWIDGSDLVVPASKMSLYGAREIVNAQVIVDANNIFDTFIDQNRWIYEKLPNWENHPKRTEYPSTMLPETIGTGRTGAVQSTKSIVQRLNALVGRLQLWYMRPHITNEIVSKTQLWFHPRLRG